MITEITSDNIRTIKNSKFRAYVEIYNKAYKNFIRNVEQAGLEFDPHDERAERQERVTRLARKNAIVRNDGKSIYVNALSPSCEACQLGLGTATFFVSLQCSRKCFYCFNPNQEEYNYFTTHTRDCLAELDTIRASGAQLNHIALTGGEPLLHKPEALEFFNGARTRFPDAYLRLYTSGDFMDEQTLVALQTAELNEVRFSIRMHDSEQARLHILEQIALAKPYIPNVMVEMPVLPNTLEEMKDILQELDRLQVFGINLLEFCFPMNNAEAYRERGYRIKNQPYRVLYNYGYAGGLPVAGSELECLDLVEFAIDKGLKLGVHYCSLENKHTGQIYQRHFEREIPGRLYFSPRDYFLKSAKVFGKDIPRVKEVLDRIGCKDTGHSPEYHYVEFPVDKIKALEGLDLQVGLSTNVMEDREDGEYLRELKVDLTTPETFEPWRDL